jgi:hypothetical protein
MRAATTGNAPETPNSLTCANDQECFPTSIDYPAARRMTTPFPTQSDPLLSRKEAARYLTDLGLATAPQTLARKFHDGTGPLCTHLGDRAMYRKSHLDAYFASQLSAPRRSSAEPRSAPESVRR